MAQAKAVAQAIAGKPVPYAEVPWFWSDQYDLKLQIAGMGDPEDELILRGDPAHRSFSALHLRAGRLVAIDCVNRGADFLAAKKLIAERRPLDRPAPPIPRSGSPNCNAASVGRSPTRCASSSAGRSDRPAQYGARLPRYASRLCSQSKTTCSSRAIACPSSSGTISAGIQVPVRWSRNRGGWTVMWSRSRMTRTPCMTSTTPSSSSSTLASATSRPGAADLLDLGHHEGDDRGRRLGHWRDLQKMY